MLERDCVVKRRETEATMSSAAVDDLFLIPEQKRRLKGSSLVKERKYRSRRREIKIGTGKTQDAVSRRHIRDILEGKIPMSRPPWGAREAYDTCYDI